MVIIQVYNLTRDKRKIVLTESFEQLHNGMELVDGFIFIAHTLKFGNFITFLFLLRKYTKYDKITKR